MVEAFTDTVNCGRNRQRFVGGLGLGFSDLLGSVARNNCDDWFKGAEVHYVHAARTAIRKAVSILNLGPEDEILVPSYHCGSEIDALLQSGSKLRLFRISGAGEIDVEDLCRRVTPATKAVYAIHYFGFVQSLGPVAELCRSKGVHLIEDCALSAFSQVGSGRAGMVGDMAVYNFPKVLPVPDGGALVINNPRFEVRDWPLQRPAMLSVTGSLVHLLKPALLRRLPAAVVRSLLRRRAAASGAAAAIPTGRLDIPPSYYFVPAMMDRGMSSVSWRILKRFDLSQVRERRRRNFSVMLDRLSHEPGVAPLFRELPAGVCPLCFPVVVPGAREVARRLRALSIPAIAWWAGYHRAPFHWDEFPEARHLKDNIVALPVHQQLDDAAAGFICGKLRDCLGAVS